ncbi:MAG TPA: LemA family protein [Acidimicrobiales bacterium]|nr:LemA family protein [Acidimicrobiales bacterium]
MLVLAVLVGLVVLGGVIVGATYNGLVKRRNRIENSWAQVDVQLQRRYDLIPNLVETVKAYAAHEQAVFDQVTRARADAIAAKGPSEQASAENVLTGALRSVFAVAEAYPDLKANENFVALQSELSATEDKIAYARQFYNDTVLAYNTRIQTFPALFVVRSMGFAAREYFEADEGGRGSVKVEF